MSKVYMVRLNTNLDCHVRGIHMCVNDTVYMSYDCCGYYLCNNKEFTYYFVAEFTDFEIM